MQVRVKSVSPDVVVKEWEGRKSEYRRHVCDVLFLDGQTSCVIDRPVSQPELKPGLYEPSFLAAELGRGRLSINLNELVQVKG